MESIAGMSTKWWGKRGPPNFILNTWFFCQQSIGTRAQMEGSLSRVKNASNHHALAFFFFLSWLSPARKAHPRSLHHQPQTPRQEKSHYISCHTKSLSRCGWREHASALVWCSRPRIPQTLHLSPWLEPSCSSNKWDTFHGDLRWRNTSLIWFVLTKPMCLKPPPAKVVVSEFVGMRYAI